METKIRSEVLKNFDLYKYGIKTYFKNIKYIFISCIFVYLPIFVILKSVPKFDLSSLGDGGVLTIPMVMFIIIMGLIFAAFSNLIVGALTHISKNSIENEPITIETILDNSLLKWGKMNKVFFVFLVLVSIGATLIFPAIYFMVVFAFVVQASVVINCKTKDCFNISFILVKGHWFNVAMFLVINSLLAYIISYIFNYLTITIEQQFLTYFFDFIVFFSKQLLMSYITLCVSFKFFNFYYVKQENIKKYIS